MYSVSDLMKCARVCLGRSEQGTRKMGGRVKGGVGITEGRWEPIDSGQLYTYWFQRTVRLTPSAILYHGRTDDEATTLKSAQYLQKELPVRIAKRIMAFRDLPFIVGCNPIILGVHELYLRAFNILNSYEPIKTREDEINYSRKLKELLEDHQDVVTQLASGFRECRRHIQNEELVARFLDKTLTSRLGIRMLAQHHLSLRESKPNYVGIINVSMKLKETIERSCQFVSQVAEHKYGRVPQLKLSGHAEIFMSGVSVLLISYLSLRFGFGLPTSRAYAEYMGGSLDIQAMQGIGTDVYLRLKHINSSNDVEI
ncbi:[3-methyl-2-oxobutanoate dehydrogenase [lipoamide]] kinase, mitochondrial [Portunus trituberculatus]|uniref:Protein-serine/threonine kinase n=1 Tax=Portunus trituberculatus TaxID=210409 RepID=A0A5B7D062_PORTR|nr:[3-methyl-2-oxobutanoate dehydrogenase [lipoamide]] kinase, mitochondrial [Portunus trituberculatus]